MARPNWESKLSLELKKLCLTKQTGHCQVILELRKIDGEDLEPFIAAFGGKVIRKVGLLDGIAVDLPLAGIESLAQSKQVKKIWLDSKTRICQ